MQFKYIDDIQYCMVWGRWFKVEKTFSDVGDANRYMREHEELGVLTNDQETIVLANNKDKGIEDVKFQKQRSGRSKG